MVLRKGENINGRFADVALPDLDDQLNYLQNKTLTETPEKVGMTLEDADGKQYVSLYNGTGGALVLGDIFIVEADETAGQELQAVAVVTTTFDIMTAVASGTVADGAIAWFQTGGFAEASVEGTTDVAAGDFLKVSNGEDDFKKDATSRSTVSAAIAIDAQAANEAVVVTVYLINEQHTCS